MIRSKNYVEWFNNHPFQAGPVIPFDPGKDRLVPLNFTEENPELSPELISDTGLLAAYIEGKIKGVRYGIGGYLENRVLYARSRHFDGGEEPRRLHLGTDIWGKAGTPVLSPLDGIVHSFAFNNRDGDYGATIVLTHRVAEFSFHTIYGHLSLNSIKNLSEGKNISKGEVFSEFGMRFENGNWPPHLHFQIIMDMGQWIGDYPGVCRLSERSYWIENSPDPDLILQMNKWTSIS
jgi:murein DD-endopeptidase MepM/ murein hydrolase activator NlpD